MLKRSHGKMGTREFFAFIVLSIGMKATDNTPSLLLRDGENAAWMIPIISGLLMLIPFLAILSLVKSNKEKDLIEIIYDTMGKYLGFILGLIIFISIYASLIINSRSYVDILHTLFYPGTPSMVLYAVLIGGAYFIASKGFQSIGRSCWIIFPYISINIIILFASTRKLMDLSNMFPIGGPGFIRIFAAGFKYSSIFADILVFSFFAPLVTDFKKYKISSLSGFLFSVATISVLCSNFLAVYGYETLKILNFPYHIMARASRIGNFANNIEALFLGVWVIMALNHFAIYLYTLAGVFGSTFKVKNFEGMLLPFALLTPVIGMLPENNVVVTFILRDYLLNIASYFFMAFPILLLLVSKLKGGNTY